MSLKRMVNNFPVLSSLVCSIIGLVILKGSSILFEHLYSVLNVCDVKAFVCFSISLLYIIFICVFCIIFRRNFKIKLSFVKNGDPLFFLHLGFVILVAACPIISNIAMLGFHPTFSAFYIAFSAGVNEEVLCRFFPIVILMASSKMKDKKFLIVLLPAIYFSVFHIINLFMGADLIPTILQLILAFGIGTVFGAIFVCTGNIIYPMIIHFAYDYFQLCAMGGDGILSAEKAQGLSNLNYMSYFIITVYAILFLLISKLMLKKKNYGRIDEMWGTIWHKEM